jgi:ethanolamine transporter EutH
MMAGAMSMDSPRAEHNPLAVTIMLVLLTFPIVCFVCGVLPPILNYFNFTVLTIMASLFPIVEVAFFVLIAIIFDR